MPEELKYLLAYIALWCTTTSFIHTSDISIAAYAAEDQPILKNEQADSFGYYQEYTLTLKTEENYHLRFEQPFTSVKIIRNDTSRGNITLSASGKKYTIGAITNPLEDVEPSETFVIFQRPVDQLEIQAASRSEVTLSLIYAAPISLNISELKTKTDNCDKPQTISQADWRKGLPEPTPGRNSTVVKHCIIHHSAGSNTDTNYVNMVRNIYVLHTNTNGWDDIGYNFLIATNGLIFSGRDAAGVADEDDIQGAHFCGKNSGTMGICLLGNYNTATPSEQMMSSLRDLLTWKLHKENLDTREVFPHPNSLGDDLPTIAMHQDGCATECPGSNVASAIDDFRIEVQEELDACQGSVAVEEKKIPSYQLLVYPNPSDGRFFAMIEKTAGATHYQLFNTQGQLIEHEELAPNGFVKSSVPNGTYILKILANSLPVAHHRLVIRRK